MRNKTSGKRSLLNLAWRLAQKLPSGPRRFCVTRLERVVLQESVTRAGHTFPLIAHYGQRQCWQDDFETAWHDWLARNVQPGDYCVEVNAGIGVFSVVLGHLVGPQGRVDALEPAPESYGLLEDNIAANQLENVVEIHEACCAAREGGAWFDVEAHESPENDLYKGVSLPVPALTIDGLGLKQGHLEMVCLDVGGAVMEVLRGAKISLRKFKPKLVIKLYPPLAAEAPVWLAAYGYRAYDLSGHELWTGDVVLRAGNQEEAPFRVVFRPAA